MANFTIKVENKYGVDTFQNVKNTYDWIVGALKKLGIDLNNQNFRSNFMFLTGETTCDTNGIDEFIQYAYGAPDFSPINFSIFFESNDKIIVYISFGFDGKISINAEDKVIINDIANTLNQSLINEQTESAVTQITINGGNNAIANNNSSAMVVNDSKNISIKNSVSNSEENNKKRSKFREILSAVIANITSNIIWYLLCFLFGVLAACIGIKISK